MEHQDIKSINVYVDDTVFVLKDETEIIARSVLLAPHHGTKQFKGFYGGDVQLGVLARSNGVRIYRPPGSTLHSLSDFFCSPKTMERVVQPILSDLESEYCMALAEGRIWKARWICVRGYISFWKGVGMHTLAKNLVQLWKISR
jgi:hypothetical protein